MNIQQKQIANYLESGTDLGDDSDANYKASAESESECSSEILSECEITPNQTCGKSWRTSKQVKASKSPKGKTKISIRGQDPIEKDDIFRLPDPSANLEEQKEEDGASEAPHVDKGNFLFCPYCNGKSSGAKLM